MTGDPKVSGLDVVHEDPGLEEPPAFRRGYPGFPTFDQLYSQIVCRKKADSVAVVFGIDGGQLRQKEQGRIPGGGVVNARYLDREEGWRLDPEGQVLAVGGLGGGRREEQEGPQGARAFHLSNPRMSLLQSARAACDAARKRSKVAWSEVTVASDHQGRERS